MKVVKNEREKRKFKLNRFPLCALIHYLIAKRDGWEDGQAKAIGQATAIFYAVAKNGGFRGAKKKKVKSQTDKTHQDKQEKREYIEFYDRVFNAKRINGKLYPVMGDKVITEKDYDKTMKAKLNDFEIEMLTKYAEEYVNKFKYIIDPFKVYKNIRDDWRKWEFWDMLYAKYQNNENLKVA